MIRALSWGPLAPEATNHGICGMDCGPSKDGDALADLYARPFTIRRPEQQSVPFVFASPHSGRLYPPSFLAASRLSPLALRRSEDAYVDELFAGAIALGAPMLAARFPRAFLDVNRSARELDPHMFKAALAVQVDCPSTRVAAGLGVIPRVVRDGAEIYRKRLEPFEAPMRLEKLYYPYHEALAQLMAETRERFGVAILIDCHSMPSNVATADIILGDRYGASAPAIFTHWAEQSFARSGFTVTRNAPYAGGHTTSLYARRADGCYALQIEISRALYLDEDNIVASGHFADVQTRLYEALARAVAIDPQVFGHLPRREAAE